MSGDVLDVTLEIEPERWLRNRQLADRLSFGEDRQTLALVVKVPELDAEQRALPEAVVEKEADAELVASPSFANMSATRSFSVNVVR